MIAIVVAGNYREWRAWVREKMDRSPLGTISKYYSSGRFGMDGDTFYFVERREQMMGLLFDRVIRVGTWYHNPNAERLIKEAEAKVERTS